MIKNSYLKYETKTRNHKMNQEEILCVKGITDEIKNIIGGINNP